MGEEINNLKTELDNKTTELEKLQLAYENLTIKMDEINNAKSELKSMDSDIVECIKERLETQPDVQAEETEKLKVDLETQIKKNNDLREKNYKAMEALSKAEKAASTVDQLKKDLACKEDELKLLTEQLPNSQLNTNDNADHEAAIEKLTADLDKKDQSLSKLEEYLEEQEEKYEKSSEELKAKVQKLEQQLAKSTKSLSELEDHLIETEESFEKEKAVFQEKVKELEEQAKEAPLTNGVSFSEQEYESLKNKNVELGNIVNDKVLMIDNLTEELQEIKKENQTSNAEQEHTRELLRRLFPSITVDNQELSQSDWLQGFELEAQKYMEIMTSNSIDAGIQERLEESEKEKEKLDSQ